MHEDEQWSSGGMITDQVRPKYSEMNLS